MTHSRISVLFLLLAAFTAGAQALAEPAHAQNPDLQSDQQYFNFSIPMQKAGTALNQLGAQANATFLFDYSILEDIYTPPLSGRYTLEQAVSQLLKYTRIKPEFRDGTLFIVPRAPDEMPGIALPDEAVNKDNEQPQATTTEPATSIERIQINGIRESIESAHNLKKNAAGIIEIIVAEDLGKFPDLNVAESLQRLTGVAIDRTGGEGQTVTVRGFGPEFNRVLLNGRQIAADSQGRAFNFDILGVEVINGVEVMKSPLAYVQEGSLGATLNIRTARPFDNKNRQLAGHIKGIYESLNHQSTPSGAMLISQNSGDYGLLFAASHQVRELQINRIDTAGWSPGVRLIDAPDKIVADNVYFPRNLDMSVDSQKRTRTNINLSAQARLSDALLLTADGLLAKFEVDSQVNALAAWLEPNRVSQALVDETNGTVIFADQAGGTREVFNLPATDFVSHTRNSRDVTSSALGVNLNWVVNEELIATLDMAYSEAQNDRAGKNRFNVVGIINDYALDARGEFPIAIHEGLSDGILPPPELSRAHYNEVNGFTDEDDIQEYKLDIQYSPDKATFSEMNMGAYYQRRNKLRFQGFSNAQCLYCGYFIPLPPELLRPFTVNHFFAGAPGTFYTFDAEEYLSWLQSESGLSARDSFFGLPGGTSEAMLGLGFHPDILDNRYQVQERISSLYFDLTLKATVGDMPLEFNLGARYSDTHTQVSAIQSRLTDIVPTQDPTLFSNVLAEATEITAENHYSNLLPGLNIKLNPEQDVFIRFAAYQSITRPTLSQLTPVVIYGQPRNDLLSASGGNPTLSPFKADNWELSTEWYINDTNLLSLTWFEKEIADFISSSSGTERIVLTDRTLTPNQVCGSCELTENRAHLTGVGEEFNILRPRNGESAFVTGYEIALNYLWQNGFGVMLNMTIVDSNAKLDEDPNSRFALEGLGDSQNLVLFYESDGFLARIAFNNREAFLRQIDNGFNGEPVKTTNYGQWDISASYHLNDYLTLFMEGINITGERMLQTGRFDNQVYSVAESGSRYALGVRARY